MPTLRPRKRASASSLSVPSASPATTTEPVSARSNPAVTMSKRRLARARRSDQADCLAAAYMQVDVFEDMNAGRAPPERQIDAAERDRRV